MGKRRASAGNWWRFSAYEVVAGRIQPPKGAKLSSYDLWSALDGFANDRERNEPPWIELASIAGIAPKSTAVALADEQAAAVALQEQREAQKKRALLFVRQYGLLGLLPHRARSFVFPVEGGQISHKESGKPFPVDQQRRYERSSSGWRVRVERDWTGTTPWFDVGALCQSDLAKSSLVVCPLDAIVQRYLPKLGAGQFPKPMSERFWRVYQEPVDEFLAAASLLRSVVKAKMAYDEQPQTGRTFNPHALKWLNEVTAHNRLGLVEGSDGLQQRWLAPSLFGALAGMLMRQITHTRILQCPVCSTLFSAKSAKAEYCNEACRKTAEMRRRRKRERVAAAKDRRAK